MQLRRVFAFFSLPQNPVAKSVCLPASEHKLSTPGSCRVVTLKKKIVLFNLSPILANVFRLLLLSRTPFPLPRRSPGRLTECSANPTALTVTAQRHSGHAKAGEVRPDHAGVWPLTQPLAQLPPGLKCVRPR